MKFSIKDIWSIIKQSFSDFIDNKVLKLSAALAFYTIFSLPAMLIIIISVSDIFYGRAAIEGTLYHQIAEFVGKDAALQIQQTIRGAALSQSSYFATVVGIITLLFGHQRIQRDTGIHQPYLEIKIKTERNGLSENGC